MKIFQVGEGEVGKSSLWLLGFTLEKWDGNHPFPHSGTSICCDLYVLFLGFLFYFLQTEILLPLALERYTLFLAFRGSKGKKAGTLGLKTQTLTPSPYNCWPHASLPFFPMPGVHDSRSYRIHFPRIWSSSFMEVEALQEQEKGEEMNPGHRRQRRYEKQILCTPILTTHLFLFLSSLTPS